MVQLCWFDSGEIMIQIGNFFFKYRNWVFIPMYLAVFIPSPELVSAQYRHWLLFIGLFITILGQAIRCLTIGLAYIDRGGKDKKVYASKLVTQGIFNHCRNPLYIGNILKLLGIAVLANSALYLGLFIPVFLFIYQAIVQAEESFLKGKFGADYIDYCQRVNRWLPNLSGFNDTLQHVAFRWQRPVVKEISSVYVWLIGIEAILFFKYPELINGGRELRNQVFLSSLIASTTLYLGIRHLKKIGIIQGL